jgi:phosphoribosylformimino-5-aminoimidazole carboxamide ribotide isomerase
LLVIPAIDVLNQRVVRLERGVETSSKVYSNDPISTARRLAALGASFLHVVDLDAALREDMEINRQIIKELIFELGSITRFQIAGGIRNQSIANSLLELGAARIVIGSMAYSNEEETLTILKKNGPAKVVLALDYDANGRVRTRGWKRTESEGVQSAFSRFSNYGFELFLLTAIELDGTLSGPDLNTLAKISKLRTKDKIKIIASGGISSYEDLLNLYKIGCDEVIIGRALYDEKITQTRIMGDFPAGERKE